jgi:hypothetical protein
MGRTDGVARVVSASTRCVPGTAIGAGPVLLHLII